MADVMEDNKDCSACNPPEPEFNKKLIIFCGFITALVAYLILCFFLFILPKTIYIFYSCATGLGIGTAISYGINRENFINRRILFVLVILSSLLAFLMFQTPYMTISGNHTLYLHLGEYLFKMLISPIPLFFSLLVFTGTGVFIFYSQRNIKKKILFILTVLYIFSAFLTCNLIFIKSSDFIEPIDNKTLFYTMELFVVPAAVYILYNCLLAFGIRRLISYRIEKNVSISKKFIIQLICLSLLTAYVFFTFYPYVNNMIFRFDKGKTGFGDFLFCICSSAAQQPFSLYGDAFCMCEEDRTVTFRFFVSLLISIYENVTFGKIPREIIIILINLQAWIFEFLIAFFCAWQFIIFTCPWLSVEGLLSPVKRCYLFFMRKPGIQKIIFFSLLLIFFVKIITNTIWYFTARPAIVSQITSACEAGDLITAKDLLGKYPCLINVKDKNGYNPLHCASSKGRVEVVKFLISKGADVNNKTDDAHGGRVPLELAAWAGPKEVAELLISRGADVNARSDMGTPLGTAALHGNRDIVELLLDKGADIKKSGEWSVFSYALYSGSIETIDLLISRGIDVNMKDSYGTTPLQDAAKNGKKEVVEFLLSKGADINAESKESRSVLHYAVWGGSIEIMDLFISGGIDINIKDSHGVTPLHDAVKRKKEEIVNFLLSKDANVNIKDNQGNTPLHYAVENRDENLTELLISQGADINSRNNDGKTPLSMAKGCEFLTRILLENGARE